MIRIQVPHLHRQQVVRVARNERAPQHILDPNDRLLERRERLLPLIAQPHHDDDLQRASQPRGVQRRGIPLDVAALLQRLDPPQAR